MFNFSWLEVFGFITGIAGVYLTAKQKIWCWPIAIINVSIYFFIFFDAKLYADMGLQAFYFASSFYGWYYWLYGKKDSTTASVPVTKSSYKLLFISILVILISTITLGKLLSTYTVASLPYLDSFCTAVCLVAQFLQARKKIENWLLWIAVDSLYVGLFIYKQLYTTAVLYTLFVALAVLGYYQWKKSLKLQL